MEWAKIHLDTLKVSVATLVSDPDNMYRVLKEEDFYRQLFIVTIMSINDIELVKISLIAGDFICNLRASLDHLAWKLATIGKKRPSAETCFPIISKILPRTEAKVAERIAACTGGIDPEAVALMKTFQPYNSGDAYKSHHLWRLHFLWNLDKHRNISIHSADSGTVCEIPLGVPRTHQQFNDRAIVSIPLSAKTKVRFNPSLSPKILFGDEDRGVQVTLQDFSDIYEFVSTEVFPAFARFIP
jgi:hypothetical protein